MNCVEFERNLLESIEGSPTPEQKAHLSSCSVCSGLLLDLNAIVSEAKFLAESAESEEPSPAVWNALEARLRSEGLIRRSEPTFAPELQIKESFFRRWRAAWLIPVAAGLAFVAVVKLYQPSGAGDNLAVTKTAAHQAETTSVALKTKAPVSREDQQWLSTVASRPPAQLARFRNDLDNANAFIQDAQESLQRDPNDAFTQQMLINAYEQKQMLFELAVDRSSQ
jgi:hypothetical protein